MTKVVTGQGQLEFPRDVMLPTVVNESPIPGPRGLRQSVALSSGVRAELEDYLGGLNGHLGELYRAVFLGSSASGSLAVPSGDFVTVVASLLCGALPTDLGACRLLRSLVETASDSTYPWARDSRLYLHRVAQVLERALTVSTGVYVYSFPTILRHPARDGRVRLKVGHSGENIYVRVRDQIHRETAWPESPTMLRHFPTPKTLSAVFEDQFHDVLRACGCELRNTDPLIGTEWFLTTLELLDMLACSWGLEIIALDTTVRSLAQPSAV